MAMFKEHNSFILELICTRNPYLTLTLNAVYCVHLNRIINVERVRFTKFKTCNMV